MSIERLEELLEELETRQAELDERMQAVRKLVALAKIEQIKKGPLGPLAEVLAYHHKMTNGWMGLAANGLDMKLTPESFKRLHTEFVTMREVLTRYEYEVQRVLGINPSPFADLEERDI